MPQNEPWHGPLPARERSAIDSSVTWASMPVCWQKSVQSPTAATFRIRTGSDRPGRVWRASAGVPRWARSSHMSHRRARAPGPCCKLLVAQALRHQVGRFFGHQAVGGELAAGDGAKVAQALRLVVHQGKAPGGRAV
jgi:hypothetical protein